VVAVAEHLLWVKRVAQPLLKAVMVEMALPRLYRAFLRPMRVVAGEAAMRPEVVERQE
jgi:hypothetical protein